MKSDYWVLSLLHLALAHVPASKEVYVVHPSTRVNTNAVISDEAWLTIRPEVLLTKAVSRLLWL